MLISCRAREYNTNESGIRSLWLCSLRFWAMDYRHGRTSGNAVSPTWQWATESFWIRTELRQHPPESLPVLPHR